MAYTQQQLEQAIEDAIGAQDNKSANELAGLLDQQFPNRAPRVSLVPTPTVEPESTLTSRAGDVFEERGSSIADTLSRPVATEAGDILGTQQEGALSFSDKLVRTVGDLAGGFGDIAGDALMTGAAAMTPDFILEGVGNSFKAIAETDAGREGMKAATQGIESYNNWAKDNPDNAKYLESWFNIGAIATPPTPVKGITSAAGASLQETGATLTKNGLKSLQGTKNELVTAMLEPTDIARIPTEDLTSKGFFDTITYDPQVGYTRDNIDIVSEIPEVNPKKSYTYNSNVIEKARQAEQKKLESILGRTPVVVESDVVTQELGKRASALLSSPEFKTMDATLQKKTEVIFKEAVRRIQSGDGSLLDLLQARRDVDSFIGRQKLGLDQNQASTLDLARKAVNGSLNDIIAELSDNVTVKQSLRKQSAMISALDIINPKREKNGRTAVARILNNFGAYLPRTPVALAATATFSAGFIMQNWPLMSAAAVSGILFAGGKATFSPEARVLVGNMIKGTGDAIKAAEKAGALDVVEQMKADRLVLISLLNETPVENPEDEE
tara:strand:- start:106 stop:1767 length:1662 start_codon:yes stop_codon:yes gene_type:complete